MTPNNKLIAPKVRGSDKSVKLLLNALLDGKKITNHEISKYATNSVKDILGDLKRDYGLNLLDEWAKDPKTDTRFKKYYINNKGRPYARLLLKYFNTKDKAILAQLKIRAREPKKC
ncbi:MULTISPECIES: hypothetical protein [Campylobacter]|uniref:hypothetical protein n=1 Tax=Campylobacter TaxID=194 RepID=UPI000A33FDA1|nr:MULTISPECIES: hypothetical protein [unclassified Campylobacter]MBE6430056.1 hypothetical protein [Campylobacter sp.]